MDTHPNFIYEFLNTLSVSFDYTHLIQNKYRTTAEYFQCGFSSHEWNNRDHHIKKGKLYGKPKSENSGILNGEFETKETTSFYG
ncbi:hypothetical protein GCM10025859_61370 [Alicyclobacillus fastidiosus]|nr:hypothetical protein GCM10025859_60220 [Alicyclobacillus fastidiosus]GMA65697.1 hypothetical protein GCM10025859_61370 [Alicyclobacillus fastidiosus]